MTTLRDTRPPLTKGGTDGRIARWIALGNRRSIDARVIRLAPSIRCGEQLCKRQFETGEQSWTVDFVLANNVFGRLAAYREASVTTLYTEDLDAGTDYDGLTVIDPFV